MAEPTVSTPQSSNENGGPKIIKDRACPFCNQAFTSSSLGRHLDLYIKPKNPKPPDGVHVVDDIRRMRGNITRRQSRISSVKRDSSTPAPASASSSGPNASMRQMLESSATVHTVLQSPTAAVERFEEKMGVRFNRPGWESTGVMNDLPPRSERMEARPDGRRELPKHSMLKSDLEQRQKIAEELENGRAADLALQEVLGSVRDARFGYASLALSE
jgi:hypothetical protein